jgi:hypothetical protein
VRIAAHRSTITAQATAPDASTKSAGASFFEVLSGASARPSNGTAVPAINTAPQKDSDAAGQNGAPSTGTNVKVPVQAESNPLQSVVPSIAPQSSTVQARPTQAPAASNGNAVSRPAGRDGKTQPAPSTPVTDAAALVAIPPAEITPVSALPLPSPGSTVQSDGHNNAQQSAPAAPVQGVQTAAANNSARDAQAIGGQNQPAVQNSNFAVETFDPSLATAAQPNQPAGSSASATQDTNNGQNRSAAQDVKFAVEIFDPSLTSTQQPDQPADSSSAQSASTTSPSQQQTISAATLPPGSMSLSNFGFLPSANDGTLPAASATQSGKMSNASLPKAAAISNTAAPTINGQAASTTTPATSSTHSAQNNTQGNAQDNTQNGGAGQHTQSQATQNQPAPQALANSASATPQMQTIAVHNTAHDGFASHIGSDSTVEATRSSERSAQPEINETAPTQGINTANVIQKMGETEMHVGMHSAEFGEISIRTTVSQQQMITQISVDHGDLGKAISAHIPTIEAKLGGELGIRALVEVNQSGMSFSGERNSSPQKEQRTFTQPAVIEGAAHTAEIDSVLPRMAAVAGESYRLDIRA